MDDQIEAMLANGRTQRRKVANVSPDLWRPIYVSRVRDADWFVIR
jgi:hypothetical protein